MLFSIVKTGFVHSLRLVSNYHLTFNHPTLKIIIILSLWQKQLNKRCKIISVFATINIAAIFTYLLSVDITVTLIIVLHIMLIGGEFLF